MNRYRSTWIAISLFLLAVFSLTALTYPQTNNPNSTVKANPQVHPPVHPALKLNTIVAAASAGGLDEMRNLVHAAYVVEGISSVSSLAAAGMDPLTERLVQAETSFRARRSPAIDETNVVKTVNSIAQRLNAPVYAYTTPEEVRDLRMRMMLTAPQMTSRQSSDPTRNNGRGSISNTMTPIEAFHVAAMMVRQKIMNPRFQLTPQERARGQKSVDAFHAAQMANFETSRRKEMLALVTKHVAGASVGDLLEVAKESLTTLGIR